MLTTCRNPSHCEPASLEKTAYMLNNGISLNSASANGSKSWEMGREKWNWPTLPTEGPSITSTEIKTNRNKHTIVAWVSQLKNNELLSPSSVSCNHLTYTLISRMLSMSVSIAADTPVAFVRESHLTQIVLSRARISVHFTDILKVNIRKFISSWHYLISLSLSLSLSLSFLLLITASLRFQTIGEDEIANSWMETRVRRQIYRKTMGLFTIYMGKPVGSRFG